MHDEFSKNRSWAYFKKQKGRSLVAFQPVRNQSQDIGPYYLSNPAAGFAQIIYVQLQFFDHLAHHFIAKGLINRAGGSLAQELPLDGLDVWATIAESKPSPRQEIVHNVPGAPRSPQSAIRRGDFKLVGNELFNIKSDPYEKNNLAGKFSEKVNELKERLAYYAGQRHEPEKHLPIPGYPPPVYGELENKGPLPTWLIEKAQEAKTSRRAQRRNKGRKIETNRYKVCFLLRNGCSERHTQANVSLKYDCQIKPSQFAYEASCRRTLQNWLWSSPALATVSVFQWRR